MLETLQARKEALEARGEKGFTLMEMLIVIAIIAILIAIAIPVFTSQLERAGEATDAANIRAAYGEIMTKYISDGTTATHDPVTFQQSQNGWQNDDIKQGLDKLKTSDSSGLKVNITGDPTGHGKATFAFDTADPKQPQLNITLS